MLNNYYVLNLWGNGDILNAMIEFNPTFMINLYFDENTETSFKADSKNVDKINFNPTKITFGAGVSVKLPENFKNIDECNFGLTLREKLSESENDFKFGVFHVVHTTGRLPDEFMGYLNLEKRNFSWLKDSYFNEGKKFLNFLKINVQCKIQKDLIYDTYHEVISYDFKHNSN